VASYKLFEHTADIGVEISAPALETAFAFAGEALFDLVTDKAQIEECEDRLIKVKSVDIEGLLVGFLSELLVLFEADSWVAGRFEVTLVDDKSMSVKCFGERYDPSRHGEGYHIKGVSYHMMEVQRATGDTPARIRVLFDI